MELPFPLHKNHRPSTKYSWKSRGLVFERDLAFHVIYKRYIFATKCELCNKVFKTKTDRHMEHSHTTNKFRNVVCNSCNLRKSDVKMMINNTTGYKRIHTHGYSWQFKIMMKGKSHTKTMKDLDKLIEYRDKWIRENNYYT